jgi:hypothetical protein
MRGIRVLSWWRKGSSISSEAKPIISAGLNLEREYNIIVGYVCEYKMEPSPFKISLNFDTSYKGLMNNNRYSLSLSLSLSFGFSLILSLRIVFELSLHKLLQYIYTNTHIYICKYTTMDYVEIQLI